jgi:hypothetical protein
VSVLPPELMSDEDREARAAAIQSELPRRWLRFAVVEAIGIWLPFAVFLVLYAATDAVPDAWLVPAALVAVGAMLALTLYWLFVRILPLQRELEQLEAH